VKLRTLETSEADCGKKTNVKTDQVNQWMMHELLAGQSRQKEKIRDRLIRDHHGI
jgi:hypothetical protein